MKTCLLENEFLEWAVSQCNILNFQTDTSCEVIINREEITVTRLNDYYFPTGNEHGNFYEAAYKATGAGNAHYGSTREIAAMRYYVALTLGEEIILPEFSK